jgi:hypothetical protein
MVSMRKLSVVCTSYIDGDKTLIAPSPTTSSQVCLSNDPSPSSNYYSFKPEDTIIPDFVSSKTLTFSVVMPKATST